MPASGMTTGRIGTTGSAVAAALLLTFAAAEARAQYGFEPRFEIGGYVSLQSGVFISPYEGRLESEDADYPWPLEHGDKLGELSMFRATLFIEADWQPWEPVSLHAIFRGVRSLQTPADDRDAEPPFPAGITDYGDWVQDNYYTETDIRELYLSIDVTDWWSMRVGKQQVSWGELGQYRLLDVVNPADTTWHFGPLESFEDTRIPLWMLTALFEIEPLQGALEVVWLPLIDDPEDTVNTPLTFVGAWGLPLSPKQLSASVRSDRIYRKTFHYPGGDLEDSRIGARWKAEIGDITYSLAYMYTHQLSPPVPTYYTDAPVVEGGDSKLDVHIGFPRQHIVGGSVEIPFESPLGIVARVEVAYEPNRTYPGSSPTSGLSWDDSFDPWRFDFQSREKHVLTYGIQLMRPTMIRALNPTQNFIFVLQFMHEVVLNFDENEFGDDPDNNYLVTVPGYDTTKLEQHTFTLVAVVTTNYLNGLLSPVLIGAYLPPDEGFFSGALKFTLGNHWRIQLALNMFWGGDPYNGVGFFRDRDEVNLKVMYQF